MKIIEIYQNWKNLNSQHLDLDRLLQKIPNEKSSLKERVTWLQDLITWIHKPGLIGSASVTLNAKTQNYRLNLLIHELDTNTSFNKQFGKTISSILLETDSIFMLSANGLVDQDSIFLDLSNRIYNKVFPHAPEFKNLAFIVRSCFVSKNDYIWLTEMSQAAKNTIFQSVMNESESLIEYLRKQSVESIYLLCSQSAGLALHNEMRLRMRPLKLTENPFFQMVTLSQQLLACSTEGEFKELIKKLEAKTLIARDYLGDVPNYLEAFGVDVNIVFKVEKLEGQFARILQILNLMGEDKCSPEKFINFFENLIVESVEGRSIAVFARDRFTLLARRITERSAETGEHYIARNIQEFYFLLKKAIGGGVITAFTVILKLLCAHLSFNNLALGLAYSLNYSISFLAIHFSSFTLATKQPAMTASTLAHKMHYHDEKDSLYLVSEEIIHLIRSQMIAVLGNIYAVVITIPLLCLIFHYSFDASFITQEKAFKSIEELSIFGMTPIYAILTGILLFCSSLIAGWFDNWFVYHKLEEALNTNNRLKYIFGEKGALKIATFFRHNISGITGNISLGFMMGFTPVLGVMLTLPLDVRHITLSSGTIAVSVFQLGMEVFLVSDFWFAILGLISMAIFNIGVSFSLALALAIRAKKVTTPKRKEIYLEILARWKKNPFIFFIPPKSKNP